MRSWLLWLCLCLTLVRPGWAVEKIAPDPQAVELITQFLQAAQIADPAERLKAMRPLLHKSMFRNDGSDLDPQVKQFSGQKACQNAHFYEVPAQISQVHKGKTLTVGFQNTAETGRIDKYFVRKKSGVPGLPAPLHVFWPADGGAPKLVNIGSL